MTFEFAHNFLRKLMNLEGSQLSFLTESQKDNFYANPHTFFIRADDETARQIWDVLYPKPKGPVVGGAAKDAGQVVVDLDKYRKAVDALPKTPKKPLGYRYYWPTPDFEYDTGRAYPLPTPNTAADVPPRTYIVNGVTGDVTPRAG
jgi:hypothetical protein